MNSSSSNVTTPSQPKTGNKNKYLYCEIPYRGKTTQIFANKLKHLIQHQKPTKQLRIIQRPPKTIQQYFQIKDNISHPLKSNLVYHVVAKDDNDDYIEYARLNALGEIQRPLKQLQPSITLPLIPPTPTVAKNSPFYIHMFETETRITLKDYHLLMTDKQSQRLLIKEALAIKSLNPTLNKTVASTPLYIYPLGIPSTFIPDP
ncbi:unnamed protein product, partial [Didymodactylos carnosus]